MTIAIIISFKIGLVAGLLIGFFRWKRNNGDKHYQKLEQEFEDYKKNVGSHFDQSSTLFKGITEQYIELYNHISKGSVDLCDPTKDGEAQLEQLEIKPLPKEDL
jgi:hypothetical protein